MKLGEYLRREAITQEAFAAMIGVAQNAVSKWVHGHRMPRRAVLERITEITNGSVTPNDFVSTAQIDDDDPLPRTHEGEAA